ncbi:Prophage CP4-57 integrase [compost metagenome]
MVEKTFNFTKRSIEALAVPETRQRYHDNSVRGLTLRVTPAGNKVFYFYRKVDGRPMDIKIGPFPDLTVDQARAKAEEYNGAVARREDPTKVRSNARDEWTFARLGEWWVEYARDRKQKKSWELDAWMLSNYLAPLSNQRLSKISKADIRHLHHKLTENHGTYAANRAMELARAMFNRAIAHELLPGPNPVLGVEWNQKRSRDRRLMPGEVAAFFAALDADPSIDMKDYLLLSLFTGARQANVLAMRWDEFDFVGRLWRIPETKNGLPLMVPLEEQELEILLRRKRASTSPWVFPTRSVTGHMVEPKTGWRRILKRAGIEDLRMHDLRRTLGSWMAETGASLHVIGKTLGHLTPTATMIYARLSTTPVREAKIRAIEALMSARDHDKQT